MSTSASTPGPATAGDIAFVEALRGRPRPEQCARIARELNRSCQCVSLDRSLLEQELRRDAAGSELDEMIRNGRPYLMSGSTVFVGERELDRMAAVIGAVEQVVALPAYREHVLAGAAPSARHAPRARGVFLGYDFHLCGDERIGESLCGPQLIEINTNAGGGLINAVLGRAQQACCEAVSAMLPGAAGHHALGELFVDMFRREWQLERGAAPLGRIAIVDERPAEQYLYPEFLLFQHLFERHGLRATICDPAALDFDGGLLRHEGQPVDLVYNRLTDFYLDAPECAALREAYLAGAVVLTPHPRAHALYADKRNLVALTDEALLRAFGVAPATCEVLLSGIPRVEAVAREQAEPLWARRKQLFFKPAAGYGGRAAYRGDKLTRGVFADILAGGYVAQSLVPPSERRIALDGVPVDLKLDLRNYVYAGEVQLVAARLYRGQTTNFRTPGGGFAPVLTVPSVEGMA